MSALSKNTTEFLFGMKVCIMPQVRAYSLPKEILPGLSWPEGFKKEFDTWAESFYTPKDLFPGQMFILSDNTIMLPRDSVSALALLDRVGTVTNIGGC